MKSIVVDSSGVALLVHGLSKGLVWNPLGGSSWSRLLHHAVDLLKGETLGLWNQEVSVDESARAETSPNEED